ncbi:MULTISPECIES: hypothetical protein [Streptomyces]|uniref:AfsR/SARP family transcriptional regulator n=1 Tax=Streptomyces TaxID=1883 RepID=UPI00225B3272|nr:hypothetical protein [Streptomyces sp. NBC_01373]MCX4704559.1 hypothetical protein [Streptomyces sp. NBC_01373]
MGLSGEMWRIQVLGPLTVWRDGVLLDPPPRGLRCAVLVCLAAAGRRGLIPERLLRSVLSADGRRRGIRSVNALEQQVTELRRLGLPIPERGRSATDPYVLDFGRVRVDAEDFLRDLRDLPPTPDVNRLAALMAQWTGDPLLHHPQVERLLWNRHLKGRDTLLKQVRAADWQSMPELAEFLDLFPDDRASTLLRTDLARLERKRLLVVEDQNMDQIVDLLDAYDCVPVTDLEDWERQLRDRRDDILSVHGALIDLHLTDTFRDHDGYQIADWLRRNTDIPASVMTMAPPAGNLRQESTIQQKRHRLLQIVYKGYGTFNAQAIREAAAQLTSDEDAHVRDRLRATLETALFHARRRLSYPSPEHNHTLLRRCEADAAAAARQMETGTLPEAHRAVRDFREVWPV